MHRRLGDRWRTASVLEALAEALRRTGSSRVAAVLLGAAGAVRAAIGAPVPAVERTDWERTYGALQAELGEDGAARGDHRGARPRGLDGMASRAIPKIRVRSLTTTSAQP